MIEFRGRTKWEEVYSLSLLYEMKLGVAMPLFSVEMIPRTTLIRPIYLDNTKVKFFEYIL